MASPSVTPSPEYIAWGKMRDRCRNPNSPKFKDYGGRGITVCDEWDSFRRFFADVGAKPSPAHSIERVDNARGYSPDNVIWALPRDQSRNKRNNIRLTFRGETLVLTDWAKRIGLCKRTLSWRIRVGWGVERALTTPPLRLPHVRQRWLTHAGERRVITDWARIVGIPRWVIYRRLNRYGYSIEKALTTPYPPAKVQ